MKSRSLFGNTSSWLMASLDKFCTLGIEAARKPQLQQSPQRVKLHWRNCQFLWVNFNRTLCDIFIDFRTATALARNIINVLNASEKGRLEICELIEHGPTQSCPKRCQKSAVFWRSEGLSIDSFRLCAACWYSRDRFITLQSAFSEKGVVRDDELTTLHPEIEDAAFHWHNLILFALPYVLR